MWLYHLVSAISSYFKINQRFSHPTCRVNTWNDSFCRFTRRFLLRLPVLRHDDFHHCWIWKHCSMERLGADFLCHRYVNRRWGRDISYFLLLFFHIYIHTTLFFMWNVYSIRKSSNRRLEISEKLNVKSNKDVKIITHKSFFFLIRGEEIEFPSVFLCYNLRFCHKHHHEDGRTTVSFSWPTEGFRSLHFRQQVPPWSQG